MYKLIYRTHRYKSKLNLMWISETEIIYLSVVVRCKWIILVISFRLRTSTVQAPKHAQRAC